MPVIVIANPKGGSGKSTLATQVAGLLARHEWSVMLGDLERQQSARQWLALRPADVPPIESWAVAADRVLRAPKGTTHVVLDTPAGLPVERLNDVLSMADKLLVPVQPSLFDITATHTFLRQLLRLRRARVVDIGVVAMRVREHTNALERLDEYLAGLPVPVIAHLRDTQNYVHLAAHGLTLWDVTPLSRVQRDLEQWQPLADWLLG